MSEVWKNVRWRRMAVIRIRRVLWKTAITTWKLPGENVNRVGTRSMENGLTTWKHSVEDRGISFPTKRSMHCTRKYYPNRKSTTKVIILIAKEKLKGTYRAYSTIRLLDSYDKLTKLSWLRPREKKIHQDFSRHR